ncbi:MAG: hypothetical protein M3322_14005 [Actinomycetota bacterium]|nr:hypothetical protein [Actinomycetota bacterium]
MGRAAAVLTPRRLSWRTVAFPLLAAALAVYYALVDRLWQASTPWDVGFLALCLIPAVFALVYLTLPLRLGEGMLLLALAFGLVALVLERANAEIPANFAKLGAMTALGFWFLTYFERVSWVVLVAVLIPIVDAFSVFRGPTKHIITKREEVFTALSFAFPVPGGGVARLGLPDLLFFALFLAAAARFNLRVGWTWAAATLSFGLTLALATWVDAIGLPALPLLCLAFVATNGDLLWRAIRAERAAIRQGAAAEDEGS